jgi:hypothetical protein
LLPVPLDLLVLVATCAALRLLLVAPGCWRATGRPERRSAGAPAAAAAGQQQLGRQAAARGRGHTQQDPTARQGRKRAFFIKLKIKKVVGKRTV